MIELERGLIFADGTQREPSDGMKYPPDSKTPESVRLLLTMPLGIAASSDTYLLCGSAIRLLTFIAPCLIGAMESGEPPEAVPSTIPSPSRSRKTATIQWFWRRLQRILVSFMRRIICGIGRISGPISLLR